VPQGSAGPRSHIAAWPPRGRRPSCPRRSAREEQRRGSRRAGARERGSRAPGRAHERRRASSCRSLDSRRRHQARPQRLGHGFGGRCRRAASTGKAPPPGGPRTGAHALVELPTSASRRSCAPRCPTRASPTSTARRRGRSGPAGGRRRQRRARGWLRGRAPAVALVSEARLHVPIAQNTRPSARPGARSRPRSAPVAKYSRSSAMGVMPRLFGSRRTCRTAVRSPCRRARGSRRRRCPASRQPAHLRRLAAASIPRTYERHRVILSARPRGGRRLDAPGAPDSFLPMLSLAGRPRSSREQPGIGRAVCGLFGRLGRVSPWPTPGRAAAREAWPGSRPGWKAIAWGRPGGDGEAERLLARAETPSARRRPRREPRHLEARGDRSDDGSEWDETLRVNLTSVAPSAPRPPADAPRARDDGARRVDGRPAREPFHSHYAASKGALIASPGRSLGARARDPGELRRAGWVLTT